MIFAIADDRTLCVLSSVNESQGEFEGVDVEEGIYKFFDDSGNPLVAEFTKPNKRGKFLGLIPWVESGTYRLVHDRSGNLPRLLDIWDSIVGLHTNSHFSSLAGVHRFLANQQS